MKLKVTMIFGVLMLASQAQAMTCDYMDELRPRKVFNKKQKKFLNETLPSLSCHRAMNVASECQTEDEALNVQIHNIAFKVCDQELEKIAGSNARSLDRVKVARGSLTECSEGRDLGERDRIFCMIEKLEKEIRTLNSQVGGGARKSNSKATH